MQQLSTSRNQFRTRSYQKKTAILVDFRAQRDFKQQNPKHKEWISVQPAPKNPENLSAACPKRPKTNLGAKVDPWQARYQSNALVLLIENPAICRFLAMAKYYQDN